MDNDIGKKFGRLTIIGVEEKRDKNKHLFYKCLCDCGKEKIILSTNIKHGHTISCGCYQKERVHDSIKIKESLKERAEAQRKEREVYQKSLIGRKIGRLTILDIFYEPANKIGRYRYKETCKYICDCGTKQTAPLSNIINGHTKSCGCLKIYRHPERDVGLRKLHYRYKFRAKKIYTKEFDIDLEKFKELTSSDCFYCGKKPEDSMKSKSEHSAYSYNGLDRIDSNKGYTTDNVIPCCGMCNRMKLDHTQEEFKKQIIKIYSFWANKL
jgi:hypothetical protein